MTFTLGNMRHEAFCKACGPIHPGSDGITTDPVVAGASGKTS